VDNFGMKTLTEGTLLPGPAPGFVQLDPIMVFSFHAGVSEFGT